MTMMTTERRANARSRSASLSQPPVPRYALAGRAGRLRDCLPSRPLSAVEVGAGGQLPTAAHRTHGRGATGDGGPGQPELQPRGRGGVGPRRVRLPLALPQPGGERPGGHPRPRSDLLIDVLKSGID